VPKALANFDLPRANLAGGVVVGDERLRARAAGGAADGEDRLHRLLVGVRAQLRHELRALGEHLAGETHERLHLEIRAAGDLGLVGGLELQRPHPASAHVAEPLNDVEARLIAPLRGQPSVDQCRPPTVGQ